MNTPGHTHDWIILEHIEEDPNTTQATLAKKLDVAVGTINWHLKRLIQKGYIKVSHMERRKLRYIITPEGIALRTHLAVDYLQSSFQLYRLVRGRAAAAISSFKQNGGKTVRIEGTSEIAEICQLTCLEQGIDVVADSNVPLLKIIGLKVIIE
jgi:predicted transcriptional regulator